MASMDSDLHLGQIAIRMGCIQPHQLPGLLREARLGHVEESAGRASSLGQALLRRKLISVSDYLYMARQVRVERPQNIGHKPQRAPQLLADERPCKAD